MTKAVWFLFSFDLLCALLFSLYNTIKRKSMKTKKKAIKGIRLLKW